MRERVIEEYLRKKVKETGGIAYKMTSPARRALPDRMCLFPNGVLVFVECKAPGRKPTKLQAIEMNRIKELGHQAVYVDSHVAIDYLIRWALQKGKDNVGNETKGLKA